MVIEFELLQFEQVFNVLQVTRNHVVHAHHIKSFFDKTISQMRSKKTGSTCNENSFISHYLKLNLWVTANAFIMESKLIDTVDIKKISAIENCFPFEALDHFQEVRRPEFIPLCCDDQCICPL